MPVASLAAFQTQAASSLRASVSQPSQGAWLKDIWNHGAHYVSNETNETHPSTFPLGVVSRMTRLDCNGMEPGRLQQQI
ncbi:hypothetical protein TNCV_1947431 [Trichonephila clavipes]|nr:hypothetical protein TNCV_1947431 [Trichonephila clavipes]